MFSARLPVILLLNLVVGFQALFCVIFGMLTIPSILEDDLPLVSLTLHSPGSTLLCVSEFLHYPASHFSHKSRLLLWLTLLTTTRNPFTKHAEFYLVNILLFRILSGVHGSWKVSENPWMHMLNWRQNLVWLCVLAFLWGECISHNFHYILRQVCDSK